MRGKKTRISKSVFVEHHLGDSAVAGEWGGVSVRPAGGERAARPRGPKARGLLSSSPTGTFSEESGSIPKHKDAEDVGKSDMGELSDLADGNPRADRVGRAWMGLGM